MADHWAEFGRTYYSRHDYEAIETGVANDLMAALRGSLDGLAGKAAGDLVVESAEDFSYTDPVDGSVASRQGVQIRFEGGARVVLRLSGTGTEGATLRVYLERFEASDFGQDPQVALAPVIAAIEALAGIAARTGRSGPDVIT
jgi:phosphoglucomutase